MLLNYIVEKGDTVWKLSMRFGVPPCVIMRLNNLPPDAMIYEGQTLLIPIGQMQGDWLDMLCRQQGIPSPIRRMTPEMEARMAGPLPAGCMEPAPAVPTLTQTQKPAAQPTAQPAAAQPAARTASASREPEDAQEMLAEFERYTVRSGDTLYGIARKYGTTIGNIMALNPQITNPNEIQVGMVLTIPLPPQGAVVYVVRPGDTVYRIAQRFGTTTEKLAEHNYLNGNFTIYPGQQLLIVQ